MFTNSIADTHHYQEMSSRMFDNSNGLFFHSKQKQSTYKNISFAPLKALFALLMLITLFAPNLKADITFDGICNSYQIDIDISSSRYTDLYCFSQGMLVWDTIFRGYKMVKPISGGVYTGLSVQTENSDGSLNEEIWFSVEPEKIQYVGTNAGLVMVLAGSFIGFTLLFFTVFVFIGATKK